MNHTVRTSNIELLRIIAMLAIVMGHFIGQSGAFTVGLSKTNLLYACFAGFGLRMAVNVFLIIGSWFLVDSKFSGKKVLKLHGQMFFWLSIITIMVWLAGLPLSKVNALRSFFPFLLRPVWFGSAWLFLLLVQPFLNRLLSSCNNRGGVLLSILFIVTCIIPTITPKLSDSWLCSCSWFVFVYVLVFLLKKEYIRRIKLNRYVALVMGLIIYGILVYITYLGLHIRSDNVILNNMGQLSFQYLMDFKSLPNLLVALCVFYFFIRIDIGSNSFINGLARPSFSVYIIHQAPALIPIIWHDIYHANEWLSSNYFVLFSIAVVLSVYIACWIADYLRVRLVERIWEKTVFYKKISEKIDGLYA